ncbi:SIS domain-containing protein [Lacticaseibacillus suibinensis]|uniref:SIS domain-containing protein n=1 Tax=Lacticaseibacillus suibinensis TaxID=2486011 RepID=UPI000F773C37|nr:SIS domain-containing protein [Lacticaseibacillus suibinensis]
MTFNQEEFSSAYKETLDGLSTVKVIANKLEKRHFDKAFFVGSGGSFTKYLDLKAVLFKSLDMPFDIVTPEELIGEYGEELNHSLVVVGSKTGATTELIDGLSIVRSKDCEATVVGFIGDDNTLIDKGNLLDFRISSVNTDVNLISFGFLVWLLSNERSEDDIADFVKQLGEAGNKISNAITAMEPDARKMVKTVDLNAPQMWVSSGRLWGETLCFCNFMLKEIQWLDAGAIRSTEFFHGPFELVDPNYQAFVVINSSEMREQDVRVEKFLKSHTENNFMVDMKDFQLDEFRSEVRDIVEPFALNHYFDNVLSLYGERTGKTSATRRYYRVTKY